MSMSNGQFTSANHLATKAIGIVAMQTEPIQGVEIAKLDISDDLISRAAMTLFGKHPAATPQENKVGHPWPQRVMGQALADWVAYVGAMLGNAGFRHNVTAGHRPRPRRMQREQWLAAREIESNTGVTGVQLVRASLYLASNPPTLETSLRIVLDHTQHDRETKLAVLEKLRAELLDMASIEAEAALIEAVA